MKEAVLQIYYTDRWGKLRCESQGKFYYSNGKPVFLADMTDAKWWRNYTGYSIAKQILTAFSEAGVRPTIVYRHKSKHTIYATHTTPFKSKGILVAYGSHQQYVLPIHNWKATPYIDLKEPTNLPVLPLSTWLKTKTITAKDAMEARKPKYEFVGTVARAITQQEPVQQSFI